MDYALLEHVYTPHCYCANLAVHVEFDRGRFHSRRDLIHVFGDEFFAQPACSAQPAGWQAAR